MTVSIHLQHSLSDLDLDSQRFTNKDDIKPWLQNYLLHKKGIHVVIARSDANKIVFRCKSGKNKESAEKVSIGSRRQITCPFKIRANYSIRNHVWTLVVMNENHDHQLDNFGLVHQSKLAYLFNHKNDESGILSLGSDDTSAAALTGTSKNGTSSDVFSSFIRSSEMASPNDVHSNHNLALSIELKDTVTSKDNSDSEKVVNTFEEQESKKRKVPRRHITNRKKSKSNNNSIHDESHESIQEKSSKEVVDDLSEQVNTLISNSIINNQDFIDKEKSMMIKSFFSRFISDYKTIINTVANQQKMALNTWFSTPNSAQTHLNSHPNTNLIPLSPLLNDTDTEYTNATPNNSNNQSIDNLTHLPNMSLGSSLITNVGAPGNAGPSSSNASNNFNNFIVPPQMQLLQIQNQNQQLPSFNTIQNQLPLSPNSLANNSTASLFMNNFNSANLNSSTSSLIPPINNTNTNTTLNPSHLLKSSNNKNNALNNHMNLSTSSNRLSRNKNKQNNSLNLLGNSITLTITANNNSLNNSTANYGGLSSPNNNIINSSIQNNSNNTAFYNKELLSGNPSSIPQNSTTSNASGTLNHIASLNDNGW
ncbi:uncharacterized protein AC631_02339 [Debaryomyces fabryi]|uniref:Uncharacterized protein n=1 Tax=Debaryomyces fabryi TaxID=58627 RepID=A0A0V1Q075_9ASCO|nr:uncharacterized protein AC631_02339 [Debaryomyces fabryi]KSA01883.1 hypothetical protein AC631_02339 [Debaryomyces fabryi]CUM53516.1 unnamed protein product [Debaryomyces fabryi]